MPEPLKNIYSQRFFEPFILAAKAVLPGFHANGFLQDIFNNEWKEKELKARMRHIAFVLKSHLPSTYKNQVNSILAIIQQLESMGVKSGFEYMFLPDFIEQFGLNDVGTSLKAMERITQFTSCEFAIRPFLFSHQNEVMAYMLDWSKHPHPSVRRFSSEGCRPRLPWAMGLPALKKDASPIFPILDNLKADESLFVRKSVANNLNDIAKDHPDAIAALAKCWKGLSKETDWIIRHGCRTLLKTGHPSIYLLFDLAHVVDCRLANLRLSPEKVAIGDQIIFTFDLMTGKRAARLRLEYAVYYARANGKRSRKIFRLTEKIFQPGQKISFRKKQRFQDLTTRKHYPGMHKLAIVVNGKEKMEKKFLLLP